MLPSRNSCHLSTILVVIGGLVHSSHAQLPSSWPNPYPGMPSTPYGPDWQAYYKVNTPLPNVTFDMPTTYAGSVSVNRTGHANNTLFFLGFEREEGSLVANENDRAEEPWMIWLNGGPGSSSMFGLFGEHGPLRYGLSSPNADSTDFNTYTLGISENPWSWHKLSDIIYVDQPVGTGYSTVDSTGYVADEDQMGADFAGFLGNIVSIFPSLKKRPFHLVGESYAGTYIPYIAKTLINMENPPVNLVSTAIGDGAIGNYYAFREYSALSIMQTYPQLIGFNTSVYEYVVDQYNLCGYNLTLKYPNPASYPTLEPRNQPGGSEVLLARARAAMTSMGTTTLLKQTLGLYDLKADVDEVTIDGRRFRKRQDDGDGSDSGSGNNVTLPTPALPPKGVINPWYGCFIAEFIEDWAVNYTAPWVGTTFDVYRASDALEPPNPYDPSAYLNLPDVRAALHAPNKTWRMSIRYPFNNGDVSLNLVYGDPSPPPQQFLSDIAEHVKMVFFSGNDDNLVGHRGTELAIQNMTFGGIRGFTARPSTPFTDTDGSFAGIVHQERNVTYANFYEAGHMVPRDKPKAAYAFLREFILGTNTTGQLRTTDNTTTVEGGVHTEFLKGILTASYAVTGSQITQGTYTWAQEHWDKWASYMATRTEQDVPVATATDDGVISPGALDAGDTGGAGRSVGVGLGGVVVGLVVGVATLLV